MTVLIVEDSSTLLVAYQEYLRNEACKVTYVETGTEALKHIKKYKPNAILLDLGLPDMDGMDILKYVNENQLPCSVVVVTAQGSVDVAVEAMRYQAFDFVEKPFDGQRIIVTIHNALQNQQLKYKLELYEKIDRAQYYDFIGTSPPMQAIYQMIENAASSKATVFITGESGTGKELCAEAIHKCSPRNKKPFIALNCAAIPKDLMESQIFGHVKGAFTGAVNDQEGAAVQADGGTLFLDEIGDMSMDLQSKLLRFIQTSTIQKIGGTKSIKVDVRFICATNRDPLFEVQEKRFREDLYYRLHVIPITLPPLRERGEDILLIARNFLDKYTIEEHKSFTSFAADAEVILLNYEWPGNIRQLQNVVRNVVVLNDGKQVTPEMLPKPLDKFSEEYRKIMNNLTNKMIDNPNSNNINFVNLTFSRRKNIYPLWRVEKEAIQHAIALCSGSVSKAAGLLEVSPSTLYRKLQSWEDKNI
ncbi:MAG: sigma-54-dependent Fis family transcriptional regulator [Candidatus Marithrix sp.]|nr:sigma-54-dependent Fis family transcriptional regulator [Candidatus Marithrix sp.]